MMTEERKAYLKLWRERNKEKVNKIAKKYRDNNKEKIKKLNDEWLKNNPDYHKDYKETNSNKIKKYRKEKYYNNIEKEKEYYQKNKETIQSKALVRHNERRKSDPLYKLKANIRTNMYCAMIRKSHTKKSKTQEILGCSFDEFKTYLESKFLPWMNWENYGKYNGELNYGWDIDHIIPLSSAKNEEELIKLLHYSNCQPLCAKLNRDIKRGRLPLS